MKFYVVQQYRAVSRRSTEWWWFFSVPLEFSVWYKPGGHYPKTLDQFLEEQTQLVKEYLDGNEPPTESDQRNG